MIRHLLCLVAGLITSTSLYAEIQMPHFFSDHMVLQRESEAAIWGQAAPRADVSVSFDGQRSQTTADANGNWKLHLKMGPANSNGSVLTVEAGDDRLEIQDVLVGEVWLASGQSNMSFTMNRVPAYKSLMEQANYPTLRMFNAATTTAAEPQNDIAGSWTACSPKTVPQYSAVAFFFALKLNQDLKVPVGVIKTAWGGKPVETFTSREALSTLPGTKRLVDATLKADATFDQAKADKQYKIRLEQWNAKAAANKALPAAERKRLPRKPTAPKRPLLTEGRPGVLFDAMIHPFVGYTMRGAIWYQGEANARAGAVPYDQTLPLMIRDWRSRWDDDFSFYFVQLANYRAPSTQPGTPDDWALLQDRMRLILDTTPKTGMAIINDVGEANDIHPKNKKDPGERLARWALAKDYGRSLVISGPLLKSSKVDGDSILVTFDHVGTGLRSGDDKPLKRFEIAGKDKKWHWATATIVGKNSVQVQSPNVPHPVAVRYAWASNPEGANLENSDDLPASVFRTDNW